MITDVLLFVAGSVLSAILYPFTLIPFAVPNGLVNAITYFLSYLGYLRGLLPIDTIISALTTYILFLTFFYAVKLALWIFSLIPGIGKRTHLPTTSKHK